MDLAKHCLKKYWDGTVNQILLEHTTEYEVFQSTVVDVVCTRKFVMGQVEELKIL